MRPRSFLFAALLASPFVSASGQLDSRFDGDGVRVLDAASSQNLNDRLRAGLIDSEGRFVGAGNARFGDGFAGSVIRVGATGALDTSFANGGISYIEAFDGEQALFWVDIVEQPDGKLVVAGNSSLGNVQRVHVCRLLSNGALDASFAGDGCAQPSLWFDSSRDELASMVLQPDGRIVFLGSTDFDGIGPYDYVVARLDADGSLDACFGDVTCQGGGVVIEPGSDAALATFEPGAIALAPDGRIVIVGAATGATKDMAVQRLLPTGEVDDGFGSNGHRLVAFELGGNNLDFARTVAVRANGSIVLAGDVTDGFSQLTGVAALDATGAPIAGFGVGGRTVIFFNDVAQVQVPTRLVLQPDEKIVITGYTRDAAGDVVLGDCGVARLRSNGTLDPVFGIDGKLNIDAGLGLEDPRPEGCYGLATDARSIMLFGARNADGNDDDSLLIKLDQDDLFRDGFEP